MKIAAVIIPIYKPFPSLKEQISLKQCVKILGKHNIIFIKPQALNPTPYLSLAPDCGIASFDDSFFKDISGYNRLMLSEAFYERFLDFKYILIYQLDAFVFRDDLIAWCKKGYDYIGAPWLDLVNPGKTFGERIRFAKQAQESYRNNTKQPGSILPADIQFYNRVGNGGLSLRHVKKFYTICKDRKQTIEYYNQHNEHHYYNEDVFWSLEVNRTQEVLKIPGYRTALHFSFEQRPDYALQITKGDLPFGCHAWDLFPDFWDPIIKKEGYIL